MCCLLCLRPAPCQDGKTPKGKDGAKGKGKNTKDGAKGKAKAKVKAGKGVAEEKPDGADVVIADDEADTEEQTPPKKKVKSELDVSLAESSLLKREVSNILLTCGNLRQLYKESGPEWGAWAPAEMAQVEAKEAALKEAMASMAEWGEVDVKELRRRYKADYPSLIFRLRALQAAVAGPHKALCLICRQVQSMKAARESA